MSPDPFRSRVRAVICHLSLPELRLRHPVSCHSYMRIRRKVNFSLNKSIIAHDMLVAVDVFFTSPCGYRFVDTELLMTAVTHWGLGEPE